MPIGVPKVPFGKDDENESSTWVDLYNRLYRQRMLFIGQEIDFEVSNNIVGIMAFLSLEDSTKEHFMFLNCPGGGILAGFAIFDMMQSIPPDVTTLNIGVCASMGSFLLNGGTITKRTGFPHSRVMMHEPNIGIPPDSEDSTNFSMEMGEVEFYRTEIIRIYMQRTGQPYWVIVEDVARDAFMSVTEAQAHGIIDLIGI